MRAAPLGGYFADDLDRVVEHARRSAEVTHAHPEGIAGATAVAVAAAWTWRIGGGGGPSFASLIDLVLPYVPESEVHGRLLARGCTRLSGLPHCVVSRRFPCQLGYGGMVPAGRVELPLDGF